MRWERLFADLEAQLEQAEAAELASEVADRTRREASAISLVDRLMPAAGTRLVVSCRGAGPVTGRLCEVGPDWLLLEEDGRSEALLSVDAVQSVSGAGQRTDVATAKVWRALDFRWALRGLARGRVAVQVVMSEGTLWNGTVDRVGADHLELAVHAVGEQRRAGSVEQVVLLPTAAVSVVRSLS